MTTHINQNRRLSTTLLILAISPWLACAGRYDAPAIANDHPAHPGAPTIRFEPPLDPLDVEVDAAPEPAPVRDAHRGHNAGLSTHIQHHVDRIVTAYLAITQSLAGDSAENTGPSLEELRAAAADLSLAPRAGQTLMAAAADVQAATPAAAMEIEPLREAWQELSRAVTALVEVAPPSDAVGPEIVKAYCPMVSAPWLQTEMDLRNPYYGSSMLTCGWIDDVLPVVPLETE